VTPYGTRTYTIIAIDFTKKIILIGNSSYTGEMKNRRHLRRRPAHADQGHARPRHRRARLLAQECELPHRSLFRLLGADLGARHRAAHPLSDEEFEQHVDAGVRSAAPEVRIAAE
jgi:hypothetical protein